MNATRLFFVCPILASLLLPACVPRRAFSVKEYLPRGYGNVEIVKASHFKVIDDFPSQELKNRVGGTWTYEATEGSTVEVSRIEEEAVRPRGWCAKVSYRLHPKGRAFLRTDLNGLDISQAKGLSFWFAYNAGREAQLFVCLKDTKGRTQQVRFDPIISGKSKNWQEIFVPKARFKGVDFNYLKSLDFVVELKPGGEGIFLLDEVSFFGEEELFFRSLKDNLRGFPERTWNPKGANLLELDDEKRLTQIARDTWRHFENLVDQRHQLPVDHVKLGWRKEIGDYTSPTNIGLYYLSCIAAYKLGFIPRSTAFWKINSSLRTLEKLARWKGFFHNFYSTTNLQVTTRFISTVDNAWLVACLWVVREVFKKELGGRVDRIVGRMDFEELYDLGLGQFHIGYDEERGRHSEHHYGLIISEARIASLVAIAKGDVEPEHWFRMYRTLPRDWGWQTQVPEGKTEVHGGVHVFEGYYQYDGKKIVPSWGGSLFEFLAPTLLINEKKYAALNLGANNRVASEIHVDYALARKRYPVWGISPCAVDLGSKGSYREYGIKEIGAKGYSDEGVIAPYTTFLALDWVTQDARRNMRRLLQLYPIYGEYGFYDSVNVRTGKPHLQYLALDQGMILVALANHLQGGIIQELFHRSREVRGIERILSEEKFFS